MKRNWQFVLEHWSWVRSYGRHMANRDGRDPQEFIQDLAEDLALSFDRYDSERGSPRRWIWMRAHRLWSRTRPKVLLILFEDGRSSGLSPETRALLSEVVHRATQKQREALWSYAAGDRGPEVTERLLCTPQARAIRVRALADKLSLR